MPFKNICNYYKIPKRPPHQFRYLEGQKFCSTCGVYLEFDGRRCPAVHYLYDVREEIIIVKIYNKQGTLLNDV